MKKLMIALCAAVLGVAANAASVTWSFSWAVDDEGNNVAAGTDAYLIDASVYSVAEASAALAKGTFNTGKALAYATIAVNGNNGSYVNTVVTSEDLTAGTAYNLYTVIVTGQENGDQYALTSTKSVTPPSMGAFPINFGELSDADTGASLIDWYTVKKEEPEPTPEPTSAMLMLLGMAGLALRRKQK